MQKLIAFIVASIILSSAFFYMNDNYDRKIQDLAAQNPISEGSAIINGNYQLMKKLLAEQGKEEQLHLLIMGSSELSRDNVKSFPTDVFNYPNSPLTVSLFGQGYYQSVIHSIALGAMSQEIKNNKVVFIISPQWFSANGTRDSFPSVYSESLMEQFINNNQIPDTLKNTIIARTKQLLKDNQKSVESIERFERTNNVKKQQSPPVKEVSKEQTAPPINEVKQKIGFTQMIEDKIAQIAAGVKEEFFMLKNKKDLIDSLQSSLKDTSKNKGNNIDFKRIMQEAEQQGQENCTNNPFYAKDTYFNTYMKDTYRNYKNTVNGNGYISNSPEFKDLQVFIDLAKALDKEVLLVSVPMNGFWYDYIGYDKNQRYQYYERIRQIAAENKVKLADYSDKEYEKYFLRDIMHIGWKGWAYIDERIYKYAQE